MRSRGRTNLRGWPPTAGCSIARWVRIAAKNHDDREQHLVLACYSFRIHKSLFNGSGFSFAMQKDKLPSERSFGFLFSGVFAALTGYGIYKGWDRSIFLTAAAVSAIFLGLALAKPEALSVLNRAWAKLGMLLGMIVSPIVVGLLYWLLIVPAGLIMQLAGRDALRLKRQPVRSYWVDRTPPGPPADSFTKQF